MDPLKNLNRSGRPKGSRNRATAAKFELIDRAKEKLAGLLDDAVETLSRVLSGDETVSKHAVTAATQIIDRFVPKLKSVEHSGSIGGPAKLIIDMRAAPPRQPKLNGQEHLDLDALPEAARAEMRRLGIL